MRIVREEERRKDRLGRRKGMEEKGAGGDRRGRRGRDRWEE